MNPLSPKDKKQITDSGLFDPDWYLKTYPDVRSCGLDPLEHYLHFGSAMRRSPCALFDAKFYSTKAETPLSGTFHPLLHYLREGRFKYIDPHPLFGVEFYLSTNKDVLESGVEPLRHFLYHGGLEGRQPHPAFPTSRVLDRCPFLRDSKRNPLAYYLSKEWAEDPCPEATFYLSTRNAQEGPPAMASHTIRLAGAGLKRRIPREPLPSSEPVPTDLRAIAIYLPQFHAIPENDEWWGKGFTEWTNVRRATPQYAGHYQPHVPHPDIGYYDLHDASVLEKQAAMARAAGIEGFCFYYYWFNGRRLLNMPTDRLLATGKPDFPFCFCWANENWTRTWDGGDKEILIGQAHSEESDERFILDLLPAFRDPRYIRVDGKPLLIVYRPGLMPDPAATARHWRETCRREGIGEIFLARMQMFDWELEGRDPGFDTVIQFPLVSRGFSPDLKDSIPLHDPAQFVGTVFDYHLSAAHYPFEPIGPKIWPGICPSWDNTARRLERGCSWIHASPEIYHQWLTTLVRRARQALPPQQRFIFINAWNEWAEGNHLEPDEKFGYAWLNATRLALTDAALPAAPPRRRVLVVGHDAARAGAQMVLLTMLREWKERDDVDSRLVLLGDGVLRAEFEKVCRTLVLADHPEENSRHLALAKFLKPAPEVILANTVVIGPFLQELKPTGAPIVTYVHELQKSIERWASGEIMAAAVADSDHFIAVSPPVAENLVRNHGIAPADISCLHPYIKTSHFVPPARVEELRAELGLQPGDKVVFGCGTMDWRKGPDLFVQVANEVIRRAPDARFIWIGADTGDEAASRAKALATDPRIRFLGERETPRDYLALGGAFLLSSREDPFPLVTLEAADAGLPAVCFAGAGGMPDFVGNSCGRTVPFEDVEAAAKALTEILTNDPLRETLGRTARASVRAKHDAAKGSDAVLAILKRVADGEPPVPPLPARPLVSVIVPNYNYASFLPDRLESILKQTHRVFEILVLDDASTDSSLAVIESYRRRFPDLIRVLPNTTNSGSPYPQWLRGIREAKGDLVWIAEADDSCEPDFLEALLPFFEDSSVGIAYCQSLGLDEQGCVTRTDFLEHTEQLNAERWKADYTELGLREALDWMSCRNTIINASAALIRREALAGLGDELLSYRSCGDWFLYLSILRDWNIGYSARSLNKFRRHSRAVTRTTNQSVGYLRELTEIRLFLSRFFPLHHSQISRLNHFLDRDYALEGIASPSLYPATLHVLEESERNTVGRLRLAFISTNYSAPSGGSEILWQRAALEARRRGHDVVTLTKAWRPCPPFTVEFAKAGIKHFETENGGHESIVSFQPDLAIISTGNQDEGIREFELFSANNIPYVIVHQLIKELPVSPSLGTAHDDLVRKGAHAAKRVFFVSKNNHQIMERRLACPIPNGELVFNPLDIPPGEPIPMPDFSTGIHIAFPANILFIHKGHDILLKVMAMEKWRQRPITINLYGKGEDEGKVREILAREGISNVHLCGHIAPAEIWKKNHAVLLASRMEGQSLAMIGAMVAGRVPIVTAVGGSAEVIRDNETGFLAAHPTPEHLDEALERAWQRRNEWTQIGIAARQSVLNLVPPDPVGDFVDRLQSLLESKYSTPEEVSIKIPQGLVKHSHGFCPICEKNVTFSAKNEWLRDHYLCSGCGSIPRERAIMHVIQQRYPNWRELRIHESSPGSRGASVKLREQCKHYIASQYDPELGFGNTHSSHGYRSEDLEKQAFPDESFDIVVTQDVMEHIFDAESAFRDIHRTLKPGGAHIFTTPLINKNKPTQQWAKRLPDGTIVHLHPPEYHGNPMSNEGSLVTWHWGFDIVDHIQNAHGGLAEIAFPEDSSMGIEAQYLEVIVQKNERKSTNLILSPQYHQILDKILLHINRCEYDIAVNELNSVSFVSKSEKNHIRSIINEDVLFKNKLEWNNHGITKTFRFFSQEEKKHYLLEASALIEVLRKKSDFICLGFGVVLGFVRAQDFIPHDDDIDILIGFPPINLSSAKAELVDFLEKNGYRNYCDKFTHMTVARGNPRIKRCLDIFIGIIEEGFFSCFPSRRKGLRIDNVFPAVDRNFFDCPLPFPRNTEGYLESVYGPDWRNPISNWNHPWDRKEYSEFL